MKKFALAVCACLTSLSLFAQVDSTNMAVDSAAAAPADTSGAGSSMDSTVVGSDTTALNSNGTSTGSGAEGEITDEDLRKYAIVMDSVQVMKKDLLSRLSSKIKSNPDMKVARYNDLNKAMDDEAKLKELKATEAEIVFMQELDSMKTQGAAKISETVEVLATDFVGTEKYNKIRGSLEGDTNLRTRYDKIKQDLKEEENGESASSSTSPKTSN